MASQFSKFLAPVTVPTGGWDFVYNEGDARTATIPAATYATILHLCEELQDQIDAESGGSSTVAVTAVGIVSIEVTSLASVTWGSCSDDLLLALGYAESESIVSDTVTASLVHRFAWYPGVLSNVGGVGLESDTDNRAGGDIARTVSGSGKGRSVGPARRNYTRALRFGAINRTEKRDKHRGPMAMEDMWLHQVLWWYFDRTDGVVGTYGTQVDPGYPNYDEDADGNYLKVYLDGDVLFVESTATPRWETLAFTFSIEPS